MRLITITLTTRSSPYPKDWYRLRRVERDKLHDLIKSHNSVEYALHETLNSRLL